MSDNKTERKKINVPSIIFGTSGLGNLYVALDEKVKLEIVRESVRHSQPVVFDSAGKYGAGLALESLGKSLKELGVRQEEVVISNKLGWVRTELKTPEPTFEKGVWRDLKHDAVQKISYDGILECFEQGNELLQGYIPQLVSVHDPDEYIEQAQSPEEEEKLYQDILDAYKALEDLKKQGKVQAIGVGAKKWPIIQRISRDVKLDWVMIANSMTIMSHPEELVSFMQTLEKEGVQIFNSAVFHGGFVIGGEYCDYKLVTPDNEKDRALLKWREDFFAVCKEFNVKPAEAAVQFGLNAPGVVSIALSSTNPKRVKENIDIAHVKIPKEFWKRMKEKSLIRESYSYLD